MILKVWESNGGSSGGTNGDEGGGGRRRDVTERADNAVKKKDAWSTEVMVRMGFCRKHHQCRVGVLGE